jgi:pyrroline-5-carboxylate reductase
MIGFIGGGNMAEALIKGIVSKSEKIIVAEPREDQRKYLADTYKVQTTASNVEALECADIVILAVKPQNMADVLDGIGGAVRADKTIVSIAAGIPLSYLRSRLKTDRLIRVMPNTPALVQEGMSVLSFYPGLPSEVAATVTGIFAAVGKTMVLPEEQINAVTAVSGSGPAFVSFFIEAMIKSGEKMGLTQTEASELAVQTLIGTAGLLKAGMPPEDLRKMVTSPGGTTAAGIRVFEEKGLFDLVADALAAAKKRAEELSSAK